MLKSAKIALYHGEISLEDFHSSRTASAKDWVFTTNFFKTLSPSLKRAFPSSDTMYKRQYRRASLLPRTWQRGEVAIKIQGGEEPVHDAQILGVWAVVKPGSYWNVTHTPSGLKLTDVKTKTEGMALVNTIVEQHPELFDATESELKQRGRDLVAIIRAMREARFDVNKPVKTTTRTNDLIPGIEKFLVEQGLRKLNYDGQYSGKRGIFYGIPKKTFAIAIGARDMMLNQYVIIPDAYREQTRWNMADTMGIKSATEDKLLAWVNKVKNSPTTDEVRKDRSLGRRYAKNLPKDVKRYVKEHKEQGNDEAKSYALAWSRYCQYKNPDSPHCKKDEYFEGRKAANLHSAETTGDEMRSISRGLVMKNASENYDYRDSEDSFGYYSKKIIPRKNTDLENLVRKRSLEGGGGDYQGVVFYGHNIDFKTFKGADLRGASIAKAVNTIFQEADLRGANLRDSNLNHSNFTKADLRGADLTGAKMQAAQCILVNLQGAKINRLKIYNSDFRNAKMNNLSIPHLDAEKADLRGADLSGATLTQAVFWKSNLQRTNLSGADLSSADFSGANLRAANLRGADLSNATLVGVKQLEDAYYDDSTKWPKDFTPPGMEKTARTSYRYATLCDVYWED